LRRWPKMVSRHGRGHRAGQVLRPSMAVSFASSERFLDAFQNDPVLVWLGYYWTFLANIARLLCCLLEGPGKHDFDMKVVSAYPLSQRKPLLPVCVDIGQHDAARVFDGSDDGSRFGIINRFKHLIAALA